MAEKVYKNRVKEKYEKEVVPFLMKKFGYTSVMQCPNANKYVCFDIRCKKQLC